MKTDKSARAVGASPHPGPRLSPGKKPPGVLGKVFMPTTCMWACMHAHALPHNHTHAHTLTHVQTHACTLTHTPTHLLDHTHAHSLAHTQHVRSCLHLAYLHNHRHAQTLACLRTHLHIHSQILDHLPRDARAHRKQALHLGGVSGPLLGR